MQPPPTPAVRQIPPIRRRNGYPVVFDNEGKTADRFTIILEDGEVLGASTDPFAPTGIGMHSGNVIKDGFGGFRTCESMIDEARAVSAWLGVEIHDLSTLPEDVQQFIRQNR